MRDKHYKAFSYRLNEPTVDLIKKIRAETGLSYNLLFLAMLKKYEKYIKKINKQQYESNR